MKVTKTKLIDYVCIINVTICLDCRKGILTSTLVGSIQCCKDSAVVPLSRTTGSRRSMSRVTMHVGWQTEPARVREGADAH